MVQEIRPSEPQYICVVPIDNITHNQDEEIMAFATSADEAKNKAMQLLAKNYELNESQILELMQQARIEPIGQWCVPREHQD